MKIFVVVVLLSFTSAVIGQWKGRFHNRSRNENKIITSKGGREDCVDSYKDCEGWAHRGDCGFNQGFMHKFCPVACKKCSPHEFNHKRFPVKHQPEDLGACADGNIVCPTWARRGECKRNPGFMLSTCKLSCGQCNTHEKEEEQMQNDQKQNDKEVEDSSCKDENNYCSTWAGHDQCRVNPGYMLVKCKKSCKVCTENKENQQQKETIENPEKSIQQKNIEENQQQEKEQNKDIEKSVKLEEPEQQSEEELKEIPEIEKSLKLQKSEEQEQQSKDKEGNDLKKPLESQEHEKKPEDQQQQPEENDEQSDDILKESKIEDQQQQEAVTEQSDQEDRKKEYENSGDWGSSISSMVGNLLKK